MDDNAQVDSGFDNTADDKPQCFTTEQTIKNRMRAKRFLRYLRELSVVIVGVAITFIGSSLINQHQEQVKLKRHLAAVRLELEENLTVVRDAEKYYVNLARLTRYLETDKPENLDPDSVKALNFQDGYYLIGNFFRLDIKTSAFEALQGSGLMSIMRDQKLSRTILDCYSFLSTAKYESDKYMEEKMQEIRKAIMDRQKIFFGDILNPEFRSLFYFFAAYLNYEYLFIEGGRKIEHTVSLL